MNYEKLDAAAVERELATLQGWELKPEGDAIFKELQVQDIHRGLRFHDRMR